MCSVFPAAEIKEIKIRNIVHFVFNEKTEFNKSAENKENKEPQENSNKSVPEWNK